MAVGVFALWSACFTLTYTFPLLHRNLGPAYTFWMMPALRSRIFLCQIPLTRDEGEITRGN